MSKIGLMEVKQALRDGRFRDSLPQELAEDVVKFLQNPGCACNVPIYRKILKNCKSQLQQYYPNREIEDLNEQIQKAAQNQFSVINCHINDLQSKLRQLPPGRKQIQIARYEDQVTAIINELDVIY